MTKTCEQCGVTFERKRSCVNRDWAKQKFCSPKCWVDARVRPLDERFWSYVNKGDGCWLWIGSVCGYEPHQYGVIWDGRVRRTVRAHRLSYEMAFGPISDSILVCHKCDNPLCVKPGHLFLGSQTDNMQDMTKKRRANHALTAEQEIEVLQLVAQGIFQKIIAVRFGVHKETVARIIRRKKSRVN